MTQKIAGVYYYPATSQAEDVNLTISGDIVNVVSSDKVLVTTTHARTSRSDRVPGVPIELLFKDGGKFIATDSRDRITPFKSNAERLEGSKLVALFCTALVPLFIWLFVTTVIPKMAEMSVRLLPDSVAISMGDQSFYVIKKAFLEESEIGTVLQKTVTDQWNTALDQLALDKNKYTLHFFQSDYFGANAFALPNGKVIITDDLLRLLKDKPDAVLAILLHEIAHVEYQHSMRLIAHSMANTIALTVVFGDMDGFAEVFIGVGSAMWENAFSRKMETEADEFALKHLVALGKPASAFATAMQSLMDQQTDRQTPKRDNTTNTALKYLSTHPDTQERIDKAKAYQ
jgi:Zn-dependent protease with chaperone function